MFSGTNIGRRERRKGGDKEDPKRKDERQCKSDEANGKYKDFGKDLTWEGEG